MNETGESSHAAERNGSREPDDLEKLRRLLLAPERKQIDELHERLEDEAQTEVISYVLPEALRRTSASRRAQLSSALTPAVELALKESVRRDPSVLTNAVFPILGSAIRKAIAEAFEKMMQGLNQTMEHSISIQGLKWRLEAIRTGKSFAEVVLLRTLVYRVEQVFLIHKETGLLLQHVEAENIVVSDTDMVSGMLTAIQDFARDSFQVSKNEGLETFQVGGLNVWVESSPKATLAAVIRGVAPQSYRGIMQEALLRILIEQHTALDAFEGDAAAFIAVRPILLDCLLSQAAAAAAAKKRGSPLLLPALLLLLIIGAFGWRAMHRASEERAAEFRRIAAETERQNEALKKHEAALAVKRAEDERWAGLLVKIRQQDGIVLIEAARRDGRIFFSGLRDPLAVDPVKFVSESGYDAGAVDAHWEAYYALSPSLVLKRVTARLSPPATVNLRLEEGKLFAEGSARAAWIADSRVKAEAVPGVSEYDTRGLLDESNAELVAAKKEIEETTIIFGEGIQLTQDQSTAARRVARQINELKIAAFRAGRRVSIIVTGHTTDKGTELYNQKLGEQRAGVIVGLFTSNGVDGTLLTPVSVGPREPANSGLTPEQDGLNRRVTFRVAIDLLTRNPALP